MQDTIIDDMLKKVAQHAGVSPAQAQKPAAQQKMPYAAMKQEKQMTSKEMKTASGLTIKDYPLSRHQADKIRGLTGKTPNDITLQTVMDGEIESADIRISGDVLRMQADIAEASGKRQFADSLRRAAEMTVIPDERVLEMYNLLRPKRATKKQLEEMAAELETVYHAPMTAAFVRDAARVYEKRNILLK